MDLTGWFLITHFSILLLALRPHAAAAAQSHQINQMHSTNHENHQELSPEILDEVLPSASDVLFATPVSDLPTSTSSMLLIGTIDGSLTAFSEDSVNLGRPIWTLDTSPGALLSSSLSKIELVRDGAKIQLIPSLDGSLFSFDGEKIEPLPVSADTLLSSSFKVSEDSVITGGKETRIYGLDARTGKVKYACAANGCSTYQQDVDEERGHSTETLLVSRLSQTIRAFDIHQGNEKWNFSVGSLDITLAAGKRSRPGILPDHQDCLGVWDDSEDAAASIFRFDVATGTVFAMTAEGNEEQWHHQLKHPMTSAWILKNGCVRPLTLVTSVNPFFDPALIDDHRQLIYIGQFDDQLYIQRASKLSYPPIIKAFPHVTFRPLLISAPSRTPAIAAAYRPLVKPLSKSNPSGNSNALIPVGPHQYPFDNGYFLAAEDPVSVCLDTTSSTPSDDDTENSVFRRMLRWGRMSGLVVIPVLIGAGITWLCRSRPLALESYPNDGIKRQNTTSTTSSTTKSLSSVLSLQELGSKISRFRSDFEVLEQLGKGGFGVVYAAKNRLDDNIYAVKKIQLPRSDAAREKVRREVRVLAKLDHVGIVRFYNAWVEASDAESSFDTPFNSPIESVGDRGDAVEPTSLSSCASADLCTDWIGTRRRRPRSRNGNFGRSLTEAADTQDNDQSVDIVFEKDSNVLSEPSVNPGLDEWMEPSSDFSQSSPLLDEHKNLVDSLDDFTFSSHEGIPRTDQAIMNKPIRPEAEKFGSDSPVQPNPPNGKFFAGPRDRKRSRSSTTNKSSASLSGLSDLDSSTDHNSTEAGQKNLPNRAKPQLFIQMELCRKETLKDWLKLNNETRNRHHILDIFYQIVCAVEYIHSRGLMHRDLKPSNVLFSIDGTAVKIADFGLVTATDDEDAQLAIMPDDVLSLNGGHTNQVGTSLYMSPELMLGKSYNEKIDVYSLGLIFFELLSPFTTEMERIISITAAKKFSFSIDSGRLSDGHPVRSWTRKGDEDLLKRLLAVQPDERPSATQLRHLGWLFRELLVTYEENGRTRGHSFTLPNIFQSK